MTREARFTHPSVHTTDGEWVGQFYDQESAIFWVDSRMKPEMFTIDDERKAGSRFVGGIFVPRRRLEKASDTLAAAADPETGFIRNETGDKALGIEPGPTKRGAKVPARDGKRAKSAAPGLHKAVRRAKRAKPISDEDAMSVAVAASLAEDGQDDTTRTDAVELGL